MTSLRDRRRIETRQAIQAHAIRLFLDRGYDATTVTEVAEAAGVSAMTVYRHFATKEDLVLYDDYDQVTAATVAARPETESLHQRIGLALVEMAATAIAAEKAMLLARLSLMISVPALRAHHLDSQYATQSAIVTALCGPSPDPAEEFRVRATAGACLGATHVALVRWAESDGHADLPELMRQALGFAFAT